MPIAENFPEGLKPTGKISLDDGNFHIMWGPGKKTNTDGSQAEVFADSDVFIGGIMQHIEEAGIHSEIGRATCRERV